MSGLGGRHAQRFEHRLGRLLITVTYAAALLLAAGVVLMLAGGISPLDDGPPLDPGRLAADVAALAPAGFLWLGLLAVIATPVSRVVGAAVGFARAGERAMAAVALAILGVIALGIVAALAGG